MSCRTMELMVSWETSHSDTFNQTFHYDVYEVSGIVSGVAKCFR